MPSDVTKPKGKHGGRRPGAGAPKGNLNGLNHGLRSRQFAAIGAARRGDLSSGPAAARPRPRWYHVRGGNCSVRYEAKKTSEFG